MFPLHKYPYTNLHELNLDWILDKIKELEETVKAFRTELDEFNNRLTELEENLEPRVKTNEDNIKDLQLRVKALEDITGGVVYGTSVSSTAEADGFTEVSSETESGVFTPFNI